MLTAASRLFILRHSERKETEISADSLKAAFSVAFSLHVFFKKTMAVCRCIEQLTHSPSEHKGKQAERAFMVSRKEKQPLINV